MPFRQFRAQVASGSCRVLQGPARNILLCLCFWFIDLLRFSLRSATRTWLGWLHHSIQVSLVCMDSPQSVKQTDGSNGELSNIELAAYRAQFDSFTYAHANMCLRIVASGLLSIRCTELDTMMVHSLESRERSLVCARRPIVGIMLENVYNSREPPLLRLISYI